MLELYNFSFNNQFPVLSRDNFFLLVKLFLTKNSMLNLKKKKKIIF